MWCCIELELGIGIGCEVGGVEVYCPAFHKMVLKFDESTTPGKLQARVYLYNYNVVNILNEYNFLNISQDEQNQYPIPTMRWGIKINILDKLWANPIPNSNSSVTIFEN